MPEKDPTIQLLRDAASEIRSLRRQNEILGAKVDTMNLLATMLHTAPAYPMQGASPCVAQACERAAQELENPPVTGASE